MESDPIISSISLAKRQSRRWRHSILPVVIQLLDVSPLPTSTQLFAEEEQEGDDYEVNEFESLDTTIDDFEEPE